MKKGKQKIKINNCKYLTNNNKYHAIDKIIIENCEVKKK